MGLPGGRSFCWRRLCHVSATLSRDSSAYISMSSPTEFAGRRAIAPFAVSHRPATMSRQHRLPLGVHAARGLADDGIVENRRIRAGELPRLEERPPVDALRKLAQVDIAELAATQRHRHRRRVVRPVGPEGVGAGGGERNQRRRLSWRRAARAPCRSPRRPRPRTRPSQIRRQEVARDADRARRIGHVHRDAGVVRRDLHRGVHARRRGACRSGAAASCRAAASRARRAPSPRATA